MDLDPNPEGPIDLTFAEFDRAVTMLEGVGFTTERSAEEAWVDFRGWRVNYESVAYDSPTASPSRQLRGQVSGDTCDRDRSSLGVPPAPPRWRRTVRLRPAHSRHRAPGPPDSPQSARNLRMGDIRDRG